MPTDFERLVVEATVALGVVYGLLVTWRYGTLVAILSGYVIGEAVYIGLAVLVSKEMNLPLYVLVGSFLQIRFVVVSMLSIGLGGGGALLIRAATRWLRRRRGSRSKST